MKDATRTTKTATPGGIKIELDAAAVPPKGVNFLDFVFQAAPSPAAPKAAKTRKAPKAAASKKPDSRWSDAGPGQWCT